MHRRIRHMLAFDLLQRGSVTGAIIAKSYIDRNHGTAHRAVESPDNLCIWVLATPSSMS